MAFRLRSPSDSRFCSCTLGLFSVPCRTALQTGSSSLPGSAARLPVSLQRRAYRCFCPRRADLGPDGAKGWAPRYKRIPGGLEGAAAEATSVRMLDYPLRLAVVIRTLRCGFLFTSPSQYSSNMFMIRIPAPSYPSSSLSSPLYLSCFSRHSSGSTSSRIPRHVGW